MLDRIPQIEVWINSRLQRGAYYLGDLWQAEESLQQSLAIARRTGGDQRGILIFLGRVYHGLGQQSTRQRERERLFAKSGAQYDEAFRIAAAEQTPPIVVALDVFRKAQLLQAQGESVDAAEMRDRARSLFGRHRGTAHIDLEEAKLALVDGDTRLARRLAEDALKRWSERKYRSGMATALRVLVGAYALDNHKTRALELAAAALYLYPFENSPGNRELWDVVADLNRDTVIEGGRPAHRRMIQGIIESIHESSPRYSCLDVVSVVDRSDIDRVLTRFGSEGLR